jgi:hypothetical protein
MPIVCHVVLCVTPTVVAFCATSSCGGGLLLVGEVDEIKRQALSQIGDIQDSLRSLQSSYTATHRKLVVRCCWRRRWQASMACWLECGAVWLPGELVTRVRRCSSCGCAHRLLAMASFARIVLYFRTCCHVLVPAADGATETATTAQLVLGYARPRQRQGRPQMMGERPWGQRHRCLYIKYGARVLMYQ